jgi:hypothetical protein
MTPMIAAPTNPPPELLRRLPTRILPECNPEHIRQKFKQGDGTFARCFDCALSRNRNKHQKLLSGERIKAKISPSGN